MVLLISLLSCFSVFFPPHAFYVSVTDIAYEKSKEELEVQIKIFTDDLEDDIRASQGKIINLEDGISESEASYVHQYLLKKVELLLDGEAPKIHMYSCKLEGDAVFSVYKGKLSSSPKEISITNTVLIDLFPTQSNIIRLKGRAAQGLLKLNKQTTQGTLAF